VSEFLRKQPVDNDGALLRLGAHYSRYDVLRAMRKERPVNIGVTRVILSDRVGNQIATVFLFT